MNDITTPYPPAPRPLNEIHVEDELDPNKIPSLPFNSFDGFDAEEGVLTDITEGNVVIVIDDAVYQPLMDRHDTGYGIGYGSGDMWLVGDEFRRFYTFAEHAEQAHTNFYQCVGDMVTAEDLAEVIAEDGEQAMWDSSEYFHLDSYSGDGTGVVNDNHYMWLREAEGTISRVEALAIDKP